MVSNKNHKHLMRKNSNKIMKVHHLRIKNNKITLNLSQMKSKTLMMQNKSKIKKRKINKGQINKRQTNKKQTNKKQISKKQKNKKQKNKKPKNKKIANKTIKIKKTRIRSKRKKINLNSLNGRRLTSPNSNILLQYVGWH